jgi:hypothetical protein
MDVSSHRIYVIMKIIRDHSAMDVDLGGRDSERQVDSNGSTKLDFQHEI